MRRWLSGIGRVLVGILLIPLLPLIALIILLLNWLGLNKSRAGPDYVIGYLESFVEGAESGYDWDDFCSIPLQDSELDDIRERACRFEPPGPMGETETAELRQLLAETRMIAATRAEASRA